MGDAIGNWWVAGSLDTPSVFRRIRVTILAGDDPTDATTYATSRFAIEGGA
jgi:hypothetical protein